MESTRRRRPAWDRLTLLSLRAKFSRLAAALLSEHSETCRFGSGHSARPGPKPSVRKTGQQITEERGYATLLALFFVFHSDGRTLVCDLGGSRLRFSHACLRKKRPR